MIDISRLLEVYLELEQKVFIIRKHNENQDSIEEDIYLDIMDIIWWKLTDIEKNVINSRYPDQKGAGKL